MKPTVAVIGSGIAGLASAYFLRNDYTVTLYEKNNYTGGHSNTIQVNEDNDVAFDTGFMVFNHKTYPLLTKLFAELNVDTYPTSMSFSVQHTNSRMEYCGTGLNGLFGQRRNMVNPRFWNMLSHINRFNQQSRTFLDQYDETITVRQYCKDLKLNDDFLFRYLIPMSSAVWSTPPDLMLEFPALTLIRFFDNHGFLGMNTQHQWYTVNQGSRTYVKKLLDIASPEVKLNTAVTCIRRTGGKVEVTDSKNNKSMFDHCIVASHADQAVKMIGDLTETERKILSAFNYQKNKAVIHTDDRVMPQRKRIWSSWNYRINESSKGFSNSTIYWMNNLQKIKSRYNYFVSIDDPGFINEKKVVTEIEYEHPLFSTAAIRSQKSLDILNRDNLYLCGSYHRYGFHEDALMSAEKACRLLTKNIWN